uniref:Uncharacterized protein n=1 Tax=mine drainage metagenome TaxID=410659 RepID=E6PYC9_9ZZZZ
MSSPFASASKNKRICSIPHQKEVKQPSPPPQTHPRAFLSLITAENMVYLNDLCAWMNVPEVVREETPILSFRSTLVNSARPYLINLPLSL